jgi:hypothetical protein
MVAKLGIAAPALLLADGENLEVMLGSLAVVHGGVPLLCHVTVDGLGEHPLPSSGPLACTPSLFGVVPLWTTPPPSARLLARQFAYLWALNALLAENVVA